MPGDPPAQAVCPSVLSDLSGPSACAAEGEFPSDRVSGRDVDNFIQQAAQSLTKMPYTPSPEYRRCVNAALREGLTCITAAQAGDYPHVLRDLIVGRVHHCGMCGDLILHTGNGKVHENCRAIREAMREGEAKRLLTEETSKRKREEEEKQAKSDRLPKAPRAFSDSHPMPPESDHIAWAEQMKADMTAWAKRICDDVIAKKKHDQGV